MMLITYQADGEHTNGKERNKETDTEQKNRRHQVWGLNPLNPTRLVVALCRLHHA